MKWLLLGFMSLISNLVSFILNIVTKMFMTGMELNSKIFTNGGKDTTLDLFFNVFPALNVFYNTLIGLAMALVFVIYMFNLYKVFFYPPTESEDPIHLTGRAFISCVGIALSKFLCKILIGISSIAYADFSKVDETYRKAASVTEGSKILSFGSIMGKDFTKTLGGDATPLIQNVAVFAFGEVILFILVLLMIIMVIEYVKFLFEVVSRYVLFGIMCVFSPLAFACGASKSSSGILQGWFKAITSQTLLICLSVFFMKVFTSSLGYVFTRPETTDGGTIFQAMLMLIVWLMIAQKMDTHLRDLGAGALRSGDELAMNMLQYASAGAGTKAATATNMIGKGLGYTGLSMAGGKALGQAMKTGGSNGGMTAGNLSSDILNPKNQARPIAGAFARKSRQNAMGRALFGQKSMSPIMTAMGQHGLNSDAPLSANTINSMINGDFGSNIESAAHESVGKGTQAMFQDSQTAGIIGAGNTLGQAVINPNEGFINAAIMDKGGNQIGTAKFSKNPIEGLDQAMIQDKSGQKWYASTTMSPSAISAYGTPLPDAPTGAKAVYSNISTGVTNTASVVNSAIKEHGALGAISYGAGKVYESGSNYVAGVKTNIDNAGGVTNYVKTQTAPQAIDAFNTPLHTHIENNTGATGSVMLSNDTIIPTASNTEVNNVSTQDNSTLNTEVDTAVAKSNSVPKPQPLDFEKASFSYIDGEVYNSDDPYIDYITTNNSTNNVGKFEDYDDYDDYPIPYEDYDNYDSYDNYDNYDNHYDDYDNYDDYMD